MAEWKGNGLKVIDRQKKEAPENWIIHNPNDQPLKSQLLPCLVTNHTEQNFAAVPRRLLLQRFVNGKGLPIGTVYPYKKIYLKKKSGGLRSTF